jgi:hypothetical protein
MFAPHYSLLPAVIPAILFVIALGVWDSIWGRLENKTQEALRNLAVVVVYIVSGIVILIHVF